MSIVPRRMGVACHRVGWAVALVGALLLVLAPAAAARRHSQVLRVGTYHGIAGGFASIQSAVNAARPGDTILIAPGDYHERADHRRRPTSAQADHGDFGGVLIHTPRLRLIGLSRSGVIVDGTRPHRGPACSRKPRDQDYGVHATRSRAHGGYASAARAGAPIGRNGITVYRASGVTIENLTVCNFLGGAGDSGNQIFWNGGDATGKITRMRFYGAYLTATSTFYRNEDTAATYGIFTNSVEGPGRWFETYASNFNDSDYYVGACRRVCDQVIDHAHAQYSILGYSGTNAGGSLVIKNSEFDHNQDGFDTNSQNNDDYFSPQDGRCPAGGRSPLTHTHSCWVFMHNYVHDNNNPNVPGAGTAAQGPVGTGMTISGGRFDTVMHNRFVHNGAWGVLFVPYPDSDTPAPLAHCQGGQQSPGLCLYDNWGNALLNNRFSRNGFFGNATNGDFGQITFTSGHPNNCFRGNIAPDGSSPADLQQTHPVCTDRPAQADVGPELLAQVLCNAERSGCTSSTRYPRRRRVVMHALPRLRSLPRPCARVAPNPWCLARRPPHGLG